MDHHEMTSLMKETLNTGLTAARGSTIQIQELVRESFAGSSSFAAERVHVRIDDEWLSLFFKDLNPSHQLEDARRIRTLDLERSARELFMYRQALPQLQVGTPILYGYRWEPESGLFWLFLEDAGPKRLSRLGDFQLWVAAARWSARFHATARDLPATTLASLPQQDDTHFLDCVAQLEANLARFDREQRNTLKPALAIYRVQIAHLLTLPSGLVHNEYFGKNVVIRPADKVEPVAVIDWETAAIGLNYLDLVSISAGRWTREQRHAMWRAYFDQYQAATGLSMNWSDFCYDLGMVALYQAVRWLAWWSNGDDAHINRWMKELETVLSTYLLTPEKIIREHGIGRS